jgi:extradiol dioxygenase family protein
MTKKRQLYHLRSKEELDSRIKETRNFILEKTSGSILNNHKWYRIFEWIEQNNSEFELKTLLSPDIRKSEHILELEQTSILIDNSGNFIEFLELEKVTLKNTPELKNELIKLNVDFYEELNRVEIYGYRK